MKVDGMLRYSFAGYSIWLDPEQFDADLDNAIHVASTELGVYPIPEPHITLMYGIKRMSEVEARKRFRGVFSNNAAVQKWPTMQQQGFVSDVELDGVNGGTMVKNIFVKAFLGQRQTGKMLAQPLKNTVQLIFCRSRYVTF